MAGQDPQSQEAAPGDGEGDFLSWQEIEVTTSVPVDDSAAERPVSQGELPRISTGPALAHNGLNHRCFSGPQRCVLVVAT